jgi:manganese efflux pump family protein
MTFAAILLIALALAVDAFAVALAIGIALPRLGWRATLRISWYFGSFQAVMYIGGWVAGVAIRPLMAAASHWLAFGLLSIAGGRMIWEALQKTEQPRQRSDLARGRELLFLSVATSIDALAVGVSFSLLQRDVIWLPALLIGVVTLLLTAVGLHLGRMVGAAAHLGAKAEIAGGLILLAIGLKILHEHGVF